MHPPAPEEVERTFSLMAERVLEAESIAQAQQLQLGCIYDLLAPRACFVAVYNATRNLLEVAAVRGRAKAHIIAAAPGHELSGRAFHEKRVIRAQADVASPISGGAGIRGALVVLSPRYELSNGLATALTAHLGSACEIARLRDDAWRRTKDLETAVDGLKALEKGREEMLAHVSHDLKTPLSTVKTYLALLSQGRLGELTEKQQTAVATSQRNADRLLRMIQDLLLVSQLQSGKMKLDARPFGLKAVVQEALDGLATVAAHEKVALIQKASPEVYVRGNHDRLREALVHLLEMSIHQSPPGGGVEIAYAAHDARLACLTIRDQGAGIASEDLRRLFDAYHRPHSTQRLRRTLGGLGLPIAARVLHLHGGRVEASSEPGAGTTFRVYLPLYAGAVAPMSVDTELREGGILLVEDDADCREVLAQVLEMDGYRVIPVASTGEAKSKLETMRPALILLDLRLAEEDGRSVLHHVRRTPVLADTPVYVISGARNVASLSEGTGEDRIDGYFEKPLQAVRVLEIAAAIVGRGTTGATQWRSSSGASPHPAASRPPSPTRGEGSEHRERVRGELENSITLGATPCDEGLSPRR